jgi:DNA (cytosine-5)-methyltransferase 1
MLSGLSLLIAANIHFKRAYDALRQLRYKVGALIVDTQYFLPQSRARAFVIAVSEDVPLTGLTQEAPSEPFHSSGLVRTVSILKDPDWIWWSLPQPSGQIPAFADFCDRDAPCDPMSKTDKILAMLSPINKRKLRAVTAARGFFAGTAYKRTRPDNTRKNVQRLEVRFDGIAGCLRTPNGGSSRQIVILVDHGKVRSRLMTVRECARLMGAPETFQLPGSYNDGYRAMGDAVALPVTRPARSTGS